MSEYSKQVPFGQKLAFGFGMLANQMFPAAVGIFMVVLVQDLGFPPILWGMIFFVPRVIDSITDPLMGYITDNTKSKWGRRRQYVFLGGLILGISFILMWQLYEENGLQFNFWYFLILSIVFYIGYTIYSIPYVAMGYEMSDDFHERTNIMAISQWVGQWAWIIVPWFWVIIYDDSWFPNAEVGTRELSIYIGILCTLFALVPAIFIKSESTVNDTNLKPINWEGLKNSVGEIIIMFKYAWQNIPFRRLCMATFLVFNSFQTIAAFSFFIIVYYMFNGDPDAAGLWPTLHGSLGAVATTFLVIPIITFMSKKLGKKRAFIISQAISILGYVGFWFLFIPGKPFMFIFALPFFSFGIGGLFTLMMSMTADVCDLDELNNGLPRREGTFGAIYWWMVKLGTALAGLSSGLIMTWAGFTPDAGMPDESALTGLRIAYSAVPVAGTLLAIAVMWNYELTEEAAKDVLQRLSAARAEEKKRKEQIGKSK